MKCRICNCIADGGHTFYLKRVDGKEYTLNVCCLCYPSLYCKMMEQKKLVEVRVK